MSAPYRISPCNGFYKILVKCPVQSEDVQHYDNMLAKALGLISCLLPIFFMPLRFSQTYCIQNVCFNYANSTLRSELKVKNLTFKAPRKNSI